MMEEDITHKYNQETQMEELSLSEKTIRTPKRKSQKTDSRDAAYAPEFANSDLEEAPCIPKRTRKKRKLSPADTPMPFPKARLKSKSPSKKKIVGEQKGNTSVDQEDAEGIVLASSNSSDTAVELLSDSIIDATDEALHGSPRFITDSSTLQTDHANSLNKTKTRKKTTMPKKDASSFVPQHNGDEDYETDSVASMRISKNEKSAMVFDFSMERAGRWTDAVNLPKNIYNEEEKNLYFRLSMRGFEPVFPRHWQFDFPTLPESLFPRPNKGFEPIVQVLGRSEFYAIKSLATLFTLGGRVRDCKILRKRPEPLIKEAIRKYIRWAMDDAKIYVGPEAVPAHAIYAQRQNESILDALKRLNRRLHWLVSQYHKTLSVASVGEYNTSHSAGPNTRKAGHDFHRKYPVLIGFIVSGPTVVILTLNADPTSSTEKTDSTFMCQFDLGERGQDVWNSLAIAITGMHIRRTIGQLAADGLAGFKTTPVDEDISSDPDI
ncbi:hypothetical protein EYZ11_002568 [Aspergillus tanneri]|uniref:Uncharacterized protein n=1 Tax=Aspergillus tanneri TaxID=1220188 RepID=A0A4S3JU15_9EURO|nr:hypothetical protein EYZ11_002568 [Aspergillus tanneri]